MFADYRIDGVWDELFEAPGVPRAAFRSFFEALGQTQGSDYQRLQREAEQALVRTGITFVVYGDKAGHEKIMPFDLLPRIVTAQEWAPIQAGLIQRIEALNLFLDDLYHDQKILKDGVIPRD